MKGGVPAFDLNNIKNMRFNARANKSRSLQSLRNDFSYDYFGP